MVEMVAKEERQQEREQSRELSDSAVDEGGL
jgi:hypothetical protein